MGLVAEGPIQLPPFHEYHFSELASSPQIVAATRASAAVPPPPGTAVPFSSILPPEVRLQTLPVESVIVAFDPGLMTVLLGDDIDVSRIKISAVRRIYTDKTTISKFDSCLCGALLYWM
jgi:hypothetical protein